VLTTAAADGSSDDKRLRRLERKLALDARVLTTTTIITTTTPPPPTPPHLQDPCTFSFVGADTGFDISPSFPSSPISSSSTPPSSITVAEIWLAFSWLTVFSTVVSAGVDMTNADALMLASLGFQAYFLWTFVGGWPCLWLRLLVATALRRLSPSSRAALLAAFKKQRRSSRTLPAGRTVGRGVSARSTTATTAVAAAAAAAAIKQFRGNAVAWHLKRLLSGRG